MHVGWVPSLMMPLQATRLSGLDPAERRLPQVLRPRPDHETRVTATVRELGDRICSDGWQDAVADRLSRALDLGVWNMLRRRPTGLCRGLAMAANEIEWASVLLGDTAALATVEGVRLRKRSRLVQKIARTAAANVVPADGEGRPAAVARSLLITGVWLCVASGGPLRACICFDMLARGRTAEWVCAELDRQLADLRATPSDG